MVEIEHESTKVSGIRRIYLINKLKTKLLSLKAITVQNMYLFFAWK